MENKRIVLNPRDNGGETVTVDLKNNNMQINTTCYGAHASMLNVYLNPDSARALGLALVEMADNQEDRIMDMKNKIQDLRPGDEVTTLVSGPIAVRGAIYEVSEIRLRDGYIGLTLLKPNPDVSKHYWSSFDVSGNNLSDLFRVSN